MTDATDVFTFQSEDGLLCYRDTGSPTGTGLPLVLLHTYFADHTLWDDLVPALAQNHRVIAPDARGHGGSANAGKPFRQTDDLAALLHHLEVGPAVLVGVSMGANIAVDTALEHPDLVRALVISGGGTLHGELLDPWSRDLQATQAGAMAAGDLSGWLDAFVLWAVGPHRPPADVDPGILHRLRTMAARTLAKHTADEPDYLITVPDSATRTKEITAPLLVVNGALDSPDLTALGEHVARTAVDGRVTSMDDAGHYPNLEQPETFIRIVEDFLHTVDLHTADGAAR